MKTVFLLGMPEGGEWLFVLLIIFILIMIFWKKKVNVSLNWIQAFVDYQFSTQDFYKLLEELINRRQMPDVSIDRINFYTINMLSEKREYLRVGREDSIFDICVAPFGTGSFVSYWFGEPKKTLKELARRVHPRMNEVIDDFDTKTRYQHDVDSVFKLWVKDCINEAIEEIKTTKGLRTPLTNEE